MVNNEEFLDEQKIHDIKKRFNQIVEYTFITTPTLSEDGEEDDAEATAETPEEPQEGSGETMPQEDDYIEQDIDPETDGETSDVTQMQDGDEVIDVDDITDAQEEIEYKVDGVDDKLIKIAKVINKLIPAIEANNTKIEDLKAEFEKRNPTEDEKINLRSQSSYPYSVNPKEYWDEKGKDSNYNVIYDNDVATDKEEEEFTLKKSDIQNGGMDDRSVYRTFDIPKQLSDYFDLY